MVKVSDIKINKANPRQIKDDRFKKLIKSIREFPKMLELRPIVIDDDGTILGGNMRYRALKELGYKEIPDNWVKKASELTDEEKRRFIIEDNVGFGEWDMDMLANEWDAEELEEWGVEGIEYSVATGDIEEDEIPETPKEAFSKLGDLWTLGRHRLLCGDATKREDVEKLMNGQKADMVFTDPPYGYNYQSNMRTKTEKFDVLMNDDKILDFMTPLKIVNDGFVFVCTTWKVLDKWIPLFNEYYDLSNMIIWNNGGGGIGDLKHTFITDYEIILCSNNEKEITGKRIGSVWSIGKDNANDYIHATQKPVELSATAIKNVTKENDVVIDVFGGSGSTLIACEQLNRICYMMEIDPMYCDVIVKRYKALGKEDIILERDGRLIQYEEIKELLI